MATAGSKFTRTSPTPTSPTARFSPLSKISRPPANAEEASALIAQLSQGAKKLRTQGRALHNLRAHQTYLARLRKSFSATPDEPELTGWQALLPVLKIQGRNFNFAAIEKHLTSPPADTPSDALWWWQFLQKGAAAFLADLNAKDNWAAQKNDGNLVAPKTSNAEGLTLEDGTVVPWKEINPKSLIVVHTGEKSHAIAFAWLTGLTGKAEEMAEELAGQDPKFRDNW